MNTFLDTGSKRGIFDDLFLPSGTTVKHVDCQLLLSSKSPAVRCLACSVLCATLMVQAAHMQGTTQNCSIPSNHGKHRYVRILTIIIVTLYQSLCRYQPIPTLISRITQLHHQYRLVSKQLERLKKIVEVSESSGITLDEQTHDEFKMMTSADGCFF